MRNDEKEERLGDRAEWSSTSGLKSVVVEEGKFHVSV